VGENGQPFEVQIRTREMDLVAEEGIAAHWRYKEGKRGGEQSDPNILWLRQVLEWQKEVKDPRTFLTALKVDLYPDEVYAFSPKGDVFSFPRGATPLDFAYKVHTDLGHHCAGARINGRLVPLRTELSNGDMVEVLTNPGRTPSRDWLNLVVTSRAKSKIRQWLNTQQKQRAMEIGRRLLEKELRKHKVNLRRFLDGDDLEAYLSAEGISKVDDLLSRIGFGKVQPRNVTERVLSPEQLAQEPEKPSRLRQAVRRMLPRRGPIEVKGHDDMLAFLAKCCKPLPGEDIIGYVTRGRGVSVHSVDCPNVRNLLFNPEREIEVQWARTSEDRYKISLLIETQDRPGMLARLTEAIAKLDTNITEAKAETETGRGFIGVVVELKDLRHLEKLQRGIQAIPGVLRVDRRMGDGRRRARAASQ
jgi:GTP pyrophosphokinase